MLYQCSGYSRLVCGGCENAKKHVHQNDDLDKAYYCPAVQDEVKCEPVEEEGDE